MTFAEFLKKLTAFAQNINSSQKHTTQVLRFNNRQGFFCPITAVYFQETGNRAWTVEAQRIGSKLGLTPALTERIIKAADNEGRCLKTRQQLLQAIRPSAD